MNEQTTTAQESAPTPKEQRESNRQKVLDLLGLPNWNHVSERYNGMTGPNLYAIQEDLAERFPDMDADDIDTIGRVIYEELNMYMEPVHSMLGYVADVRKAPDVIEKNRKKDILRLLTPDQVEQYNAINDQADADLAAAQKTIKDAESKLKHLVLHHVDWDWEPDLTGGLDVEVRTRDNWDNALLEGYAIARPEILAIKKTTRAAYIVKVRK